MARKRRRPSDSGGGKSKVGISLTSKAFDLLNRIAEKAQLSKSELIERFVLGSMAIASNEAEKTVAIETDTEGTNESPTQVKIAIVTGTPAESSQSLQQQAEEPTQLLDNLQKQLTAQQSLLEEKTQNCESLQRQTQEQAELVDNLQKQLTAQQSLLEEKTQNCQLLQRQIQKQAELIVELQEELSQRERVATLVAYIDRLKPLAELGKMYLKKRDRTYF